MAAAEKEPCYIVILVLSSKSDYSRLYAFLKTYSSWATLHTAAWAIVTTKTAKQLRDDIQKYLGDTDRVLVVRSSGEGAWRNFPNSSEWLKKHL
jgi:hypothetical protein